MRPHNHAFCAAVAEHFDCPGPVYEFGSFQVAGQEEHSNLRRLFPSRDYVGCDMRPGPGVDRVEDVTNINLPDASAGTVLCVETFEHVFEVRRAFDEVFRILRPGGVFVLTSPFYFHIHAYPDDYWRISPTCLRRLLAPYAGRVVGAQGHATTPHTVMSLAIKAPAPPDVVRRAERLMATYQTWLADRDATLGASSRLRRAARGVFRSRAERRQILDYNRAAFQIEVAQPAARPLLAKVG